MASTYAVGDKVWIDADRDGVEDAGELPLSGVTVNLVRPGATPEVIATTTTDAQGRYVFDGLPSGQYQVEFDLTTASGDLRFTSSDVGSDDAADSDALPATEGAKVARTAVFTLDHSSPLTAGAAYSSANGLAMPLTASEGIDPTWDAGVVTRTYAVGDVVWIDSDRDGVQDAGEPPLAGVGVELYLDDAAVPSATTVTDATGAYVFDGLPAGDYRLRFVLTPAQAAQYRFTGVVVGGDATVDSNASTDSSDLGYTAVFHLDATDAALVPSSTYTTRTLTATEGIDPSWDAGVVQRTYAVGDVVWSDLDRDGVQDDGEPGDYRVEFQLTPAQSAEGRPTVTGAGTAATDSDGVEVATGIARTPLFTLGTGNTALTTTYPPATVRASEGIDPTWDLGIVTRTYAVGDRVWIDSNRDGVQDPGELPLAGVTVDLYRSGEDAPIATTTTDANGRYLFDELAAGRYRLHFTPTDAQKALYRFTLLNEGDPIVDSDSDVFGWTPEFVLGAGNTRTVSAAQYAYRPVLATEGVDSSWDVGVELVASATQDGLAVTGGQFAWWLPAGGILLVLAGLVIVVARTRRRSAD